MTDPPSVSSDRLAGWVETDRTVETAFDAKVVSVEAATVVYDDQSLREQIADATGLDHQWRFFLATRLVLSPRTDPSGPLTRLVTDRARAGFRDRLADRGFRNLRETDTRRETRNDTTAREATYDAVTPVDSVRLRTRAHVAVWPDDRSYLLAGGGYPVAVRSSGDASDAVRAAIDPDQFATELDALIDAVG